MNTMMPSLVGWLEELRLRLRMGHRVQCSDDPLRRCFGFTDFDDGVTFDLGLTAVKNYLGTPVFLAWCEEHEADPAKLAEAFKTPEGRNQLVDGTLLGS